MLGIGLLGWGVVGSGLARALLEGGEALARQAGTPPLALRKALVRDPTKPRPYPAPPGLLTTDPEEVLGDPSIALIVEVMGGEEPARTYIERALRRGKGVVTANKEVIAKHGPALLALAGEMGVPLLFEASVGGGIPILGPLLRDLRGNRVASVRAIINGTTNYILTQMSRRGKDLPTALGEAQALGYAEPDPTNDLEGWDAAYKLSILASLAFGSWVRPEEVFCEGITRLHPKDFRYAHELGYEIKLLAIGRRVEGKVEVRVHPALVPQESPLARVDGALNAIEVEGDLVGRVVFSGPGAGSHPTASALLGDILSIARDREVGRFSPPFLPSSTPLPLLPMGDVETKYYIRMDVLDRAGVLAQIARVLGDHNISIAAVIQKDADPQVGTAEIVITTHPSREEAVQRALSLIARLEVVREINALLRVEAS